MLSDELFLKMTRAAADGGVNPGLQLGLGHEIESRASDTSDMRSNLWILYALVKGMAESGQKPRVLEIGTNDGTSTLALLKAASETDGRVDSIDIAEVPVAHAIIDKLELRSWWTFHHGDSKDVLPKLVAEGRQFDVIFIDGSHEYEATAREIEFAKTQLAPGGILTSHDNWCNAIDVNWNKPFGERALRGSGENALGMLSGSEWVGVVFPFGCNLGIFRRRTDCLGEIETNLNAARAEGLIK